MSENLDSNVEIENLTELLTNSVNMTSKFYDIFLNPTPMYVFLQQYDSNNELKTVKIPNRAMDRTIAQTGEADPAGIITGAIGSFYINTKTEEVFVKMTGDEESTDGWVPVLSENQAVNLINNILEGKGYLIEPEVAEFLQANGYKTVAELESTDPNNPGVLTRYVLKKALDSTLTQYVQKSNLDKDTIGEDNKVIKVLGFKNANNESDIKSVKVWVGTEDDLILNNVEIKENILYITTD